jgi:hypothetical protein
LRLFIIFARLPPVCCYQTVIRVGILADDGRMAKQPTTATKRATFIETMDCLPVSKVPEGPRWTYEIELYQLGTRLWTWSFAWQNMRTRHVHG